MNLRPNFTSQDIRIKLVPINWLRVNILGCLMVSEHAGLGYAEHGVVVTNWKQSGKEQYCVPFAFGSQRM